MWSTKIEECSILRSAQGLQASGVDNMSRKKYSVSYHNAHIQRFYSLEDLAWLTELFGLFTAIAVLCSSSRLPCIECRPVTRMDVGHIRNHARHLPSTL